MADPKQIATHATDAAYPPPAVSVPRASNHPSHQSHWSYENGKHYTASAAANCDLKGKKS